jgi:hypothetical protein
MWGERGLVATLFMDLVEISISKKENSLWEKFFNEIIEIQEPLKLKKEEIEKVDVIIEPDFGNAGWGHPDVVISMKVKGQNDRKIFFIEAKRDKFEKECKNKEKRGENGFNSSLNGQIELRYCFTRALIEWNNPEQQIEDPDWILETEYDKDRNSKKRLLKKGPVLDEVIKEYHLKTIFENYYYIALTQDTTNPLNNLSNDIQPELFDTIGHDCWNALIQKQIGWFNFGKIEKLIDDFEYTERSLFSVSYKLNKSNMKILCNTNKDANSGDNDNDDDNNIGFTNGVTMIYAPDINKNTFLHFSWKGNSCVLRDYSKNQLREIEDKTTVFVRERIIIERYIPNRKAITEFDFWHKITEELNQTLQK